MSETTFSLLSPVQKQQIAAAVNRYRQHRTILRDPYQNLRETISNLSYSYVESISDKDVKFGLTNRDIPIVYQIGLRYISSQSTNRKLSSANGMVLFLEAADENYGPAEFTLGCELLFGRFKHPYIVPEHGIHYLQRAIAHKVPEAAYLMGMINLLGYRNTPPNYPDAIKYFQIGAKLGSSDAAFHLAQLWYEQNLELGRYEFDWYPYIEQAARGGNQLAQLILCERQVAEMLNGKLDLHAIFKMLGALSREYAQDAGEIMQDLIEIFQLTPAQITEIQEGVHYLEAREFPFLLAEHEGLAQELFQLNQLWARDQRLTEAMYRKVRSQYRHATQVVERHGLANSGYEESILHVLPLFYVAHHNFLKERPQEIPERATREFEEFLDRYNNKRRQDHDEYQRKHKLIRNYPAQRTTRRTNTFGKISKNALKAQLKNNNTPNQQRTTTVGTSLYKRRLGLVSQQARMWTKGIRKGMCSTIQTLGSIQQLQAPKLAPEADPLQEALEKKRNYQGVYRLLGMYGVQYYMQHRDVYYRKTHLRDSSVLPALPILTQRAWECQGAAGSFTAEAANNSTYPGLRNFREYNNWALESEHLARESWVQNGRLVNDPAREGYVLDSWSKPARQRLGQLVQQALSDAPQDLATAWKDFKFLYTTLLVRHLDFAAELRQRVVNYREREQAQQKATSSSASSQGTAQGNATTVGHSTTSATNSEQAAVNTAASPTPSNRKGRKGGTEVVAALADETTLGTETEAAATATTGTGKKITKALFGSAISSVVTVFKKPHRTKSGPHADTAQATATNQLLRGEFGLDYADDEVTLAPIQSVAIDSLTHANLNAALSVLSLESAQELAATAPAQQGNDSVQATEVAEADTNVVTEAQTAPHTTYKTSTACSGAEPVLIPLPVPQARSPYPKLTSNAAERVIATNEAYYCEALASELERFNGLKLPSASEVHAQALAQAQLLRQQRLETSHIFTDLSGIYEASDYQFAYEDDFSASDDDEVDVDSTAAQENTAVQDNTAQQDNTTQPTAALPATESTVGATAPVAEVTPLAADATPQAAAVAEVSATINVVVETTTSATADTTLSVVAPALPEAQEEAAARATEA